MASSVSLVLGAGIADVNMSVPDLVGLTYADAKVMMEGTGLSFGTRLFEPGVKDSLSAYIYKQTPGHLDEDRKVSRIHLGQMIDIWLQVEKPVKDSTAPRPPDAPAANNY